VGACGFLGAGGRHSPEAAVNLSRVSALLTRLAAFFFFSTLLNVPTTHQGRRSRRRHPHPQHPDSAPHAARDPRGSDNSPATRAPAVPLTPQIRCLRRLPTRSPARPRQPTRFARGRTTARRPSYRVVRRGCRSSGLLPVSTPGVFTTRTMIRTLIGIQSFYV
jgi:hypothetical protein